ncbi:MAG: hypothetical protein RR588_01230 [Solibacillus sp.]
MNDYKRALHEVAGDMKASEQRLKNKLLHHKSPKRKKPFFLIPVGIVGLFMMLMVSWFMTEVKVDTKQASSIIEKNELLYEFYVAREQVLVKDSDQYKENGFSDYIQALGVLELAKQYELTITKEEYEKQLFDSNGIIKPDKLQDMLLRDMLRYDSSEINDPEKLLQQMLDMAHISYEEFEQQLMPILVEQQIYRKKLSDLWHEKFPRMNVVIAEFYTAQQVTLHMKKQYGEDIEQFQQKHQIEVMSNSTQMPTVGIVAAVDENMFYFVENMTPQELATLTEEQIFNQPEERQASWILNGEEVPVEVGSIISVEILVTNIVTELIQHEISLNGGITTLLTKDRVSEIREVTLNGDGVQLMEQLIEEVDWQAGTVGQVRDKPLYIVHAKDTSYTIWEDHRKQWLITPFGQYKVATISQIGTIRWKALIEENATK